MKHLILNYRPIPAQGEDILASTGPPSIEGGMIRLGYYHDQCSQSFNGAALN